MRHTPRFTSIRAEGNERTRTLPGDYWIPRATGSFTHAITIAAPPSAVWPWLVQMGAGRGGWYSYDFLDNRGYHSARAVMPEYQSLSVGSLMPALPGSISSTVKPSFIPGSPSRPPGRLR